MLVFTLPNDTVERRAKSTPVDMLGQRITGVLANHINTQKRYFMKHVLRVT